MLANAVRICEAKFGVLFRCEGEALRAVALHGAPALYAEERRRNPVIRPSASAALGRAMATKQPVQIADVQDEPHYSDAPSPSCPPRRSRQKLAVSSTGGESYPLCKMARNRVF